MSSVLNIGFHSFSAVVLARLDIELLCRMEFLEHPVMKYICIAIASSCIGNLIGSQYQMPQWIMWALLVLGTIMWCLSKWMDRSEEKSSGEF